MRTQHISNIFCLSFDSANRRVFSAGNDDQVIAHDVETGNVHDVFLHDQPVYGISIDPLNDNVFASACDDGRILLYDIREHVNPDPFCLAKYNLAFHAVMFNPVEPRIITTANAKEGVGLWDIRKPQHILLQYGGSNASQSCMSVRFNQQGTHILALRRRLPPVLYAVHSPHHVCLFDHPGYYNSCTMKSCCFAGEDDEFVLSGSDDFNLYIWKIPNLNGTGQWVDSAHMILRGHRSIVNQVRFNPSNCIIASSGVEKLIKLWSPFPLPESSGGLHVEADSVEKQRKVFSHEEYISLVLRSEQFMSHDYSHRSTKEDPRMMAFFDSLVQREIEGWSSDGSNTGSTDLSTVLLPEVVHTHTRSVSSDSDSAHSEATPRDLHALAVAYVESLEEHVAGTADDNAEAARAESPPGASPNRISELIAKKRSQLVRLARTRPGPGSRPPRDSSGGSSSSSSDSGRAAADSDGKRPRTRTGSRKKKTKFLLEYSDSSDEDWDPLWDGKRRPSASDGSNHASVSHDGVNYSCASRGSRRNGAFQHKKRYFPYVSNTTSDSDGGSSTGSDGKREKAKKSSSKRFKYLSGGESSTKNESDVDARDISSCDSSEASDGSYRRCAKSSEVPMQTVEDALITLSTQTSHNSSTERSDVVDPDCDGVYEREEEVVTPNGKRYEGVLGTPDSGIVVTCNSGTSAVNYDGQQRSSEVKSNGEACNQVTFRRLKNNNNINHRITRNFRKRICDSDSN
ncbi:DDB1- and CUL4-associated factor 5 isoform X2 [Bacillus rossius redtenbacheri]